MTFTNQLLNANTDTDGPHGKEAGICNALTSTNVRLKRCGLPGDPWKSNEHVRVFQSNRTASREASWRSTAVVKGWLRMAAAQFNECKARAAVRDRPQVADLRPTKVDGHNAIERRSRPSLNASRTRSFRTGREPRGSRDTASAASPVRCHPTRQLRRKCANRTAPAALRRT